MKKLLLITSTICASCGLISQPYLAGMLGVSTYAARRIIDAIMVGSSIWTVIALLVSGGTAAALAWRLANRAIQRFGRSVAITW